MPGQTNTFLSSVELGTFGYVILPSFDLRMLELLQAGTSTKTLRGVFTLVVLVNTGMKLASFNLLLCG